MTSRKPIAAGNWKMNKSVTETGDFIGQLIEQVDSDQCEIIVAPTFVALDTAVAKSKNTYIQIAAQNCYFKESGAFTGEISPLFLQEMGVSHVILGHSERRTIFGETDSNIRAKMQLAMKHGLVPIFCIGETLEQREAGQVKEVLREQIQQGLQDIAISGENMIIAYEPVWAIGTGKVAGKEDAEQAHAFVRELIQNMYDEQVANEVRILYGGSAKPDNIGELMSMPNVDGGLIGGASLDIASFAKMIQVMQTTQK